MSSLIPEHRGFKLKDKYRINKSREEWDIDMANKELLLHYRIIEQAYKNCQDSMDQRFNIMDKLNAIETNAGLKIMNPIHTEIEFKHLKTLDVGQDSAYDKFLKSFSIYKNGNVFDRRRIKLDYHYFLEMNELTGAKPVDIEPREFIANMG